MKTAEYNNYKKLIKSYYTEDLETGKLSDLIADLKKDRESNGTTYGAGLLAVQIGCFACYFDTVEQELAEIYGADFKAELYHTKGGEWRSKGGEPYIWTIYKHKIAKTIETMERKGEL